MREPILEHEKIYLAKYESIVKAVIDEYDPIGVMDCAPDNHYEQEIRDITLRLSRAKSCEDIVDIMYVILSYWFGMGEGGSREKLMEPAIKLAGLIGLCKKCPSD